MSREIRRVPVNWEHPKKADGKFRALPDKNDYMPSGEWYQLFETVSEGTPLSPPFETKDELKRWLSENVDFWGRVWNNEAADYIVERGYAPSGIYSNGRFFLPEEQYLLTRPDAHWPERKQHRMTHDQYQSMRFQAAVAAMHGILSGNVTIDEPKVPNPVSAASCIFADALLKELGVEEEK